MFFSRFLVVSHAMCISRSVRKLSKVVQTHYEVLGLTSAASQRDIRNAFLQLSKKLHPDLNPGDPSSHVKFVRLLEAYSVLCNVESRRQYDVGYVRSTQSAQHSRSRPADWRFTQRSDSANDSSYRSRRVDEETFWDEFTWDADDTEADDTSYYSTDSSSRKAQQLAHVVLLLNSLMLFVGMLCTFHAIANGQRRRRAYRYWQQKRHLRY